ncbi:hypothetical protein Pcinc_000661 [Petrolisthes cinctipes]|uniref:Uncharacterized protein n=1 Tax=Petrolisthes cinctipes TaxID=88211 RepID=A0AAE1GLW7_PETCI|nr:hypothetical protein Pcinc_000661 [Petrolisthes cinctipes]
MTRNRYQVILKYIHFNDNNHIDRSHAICSWTENRCAEKQLIGRLRGSSQGVLVIVPWQRAHFVRRQLVHEHSAVSVLERSWNWFMWHSEGEQKMYAQVPCHSKEGSVRPPEM